jgi:hypothetical protein
VAKPIAPTSAARTTIDLHMGDPPQVGSDNRRSLFYGFATGNHFLRQPTLARDFAWQFRAFGFASRRRLSGVDLRWLLVSSTGATRLT